MQMGFQGRSVGLRLAGEGAIRSRWRKHPGRVRFLRGRPGVEPRRLNAATMINNDVLRSVRHLLDLGESKLIEICRLADAGFAIGRSDIRAYLQKEGEDGYLECPDPVLARFLDGLVIELRGRIEGQPARPLEARITNNLVLKKLRVAFALQDVDMHEVFELAGFPVSKPELSALFRHPEHRNYRACGDQMLRNFLNGLHQSLGRAGAG